MADRVISPRRVIFIDRRFQLRFMLIFLLLVVVGTACFATATYMILSRDVGDSLYRAHQQIRTTGELILPTILMLSGAFVLILSVATALITLYVTHRISGPLYAMNRYLHLMGEGRLNFDARLRTDDQLGSLAHTLTETVEQLAERIRAVKRTAADSSCMVQHLSHVQQDGADAKRLVAELEIKIRDLEALLAFFQEE
jgi:methyl-accepting chemotaxis protein